MKICIITVNYNNSLLTVNLASNIKKVFLHCNYDLYIVDNNSNSDQKNLLKNIENATVIYNKYNSGYFQGINIILKQINVKNYDYIIIGNNDICFDETFSHNLLKNNVLSDEYVISPRIVDFDGIEQNPMILHNISLFKLFFYEVYYSNYFLGILLYKIWQLIKIRKKSKVDKSKKVIFLGYGAVYILTPFFFLKNSLLDTPPFIMGEESFLANQINKSGGKIYYNGELVVYHKDHSSCSKIPMKKMYYITKESYRIYRKFLWNLPKI